ncbi:MAG TPA: tetratricopeptide repeat protein [Rhizomicrobium sp.]|jgi:tetratricopeptide (TPR) repeat protein|nr:tetratricopeptide repeat protein [Rhizomicrobium sp.]
MRIGTRFCAAILALAALSGPARTAPTLPFPEISAALNAGNGAEALALVDAALGEAGLDGVDRARLFLDRGLAHQLQADPESALADISQAIDGHRLTSPEQARAYLERGLILDGMGQLSDAIGDYGAALRLDPASAAALNNRANVYRRQNRFEDARRDYLASLAANNPAPEYPYYGLGQIAEIEGRPEEAKTFYGRAVAANPGYGLAAARLAALGIAPTAPAITLRPPRSMTAQNVPLALHAPAPKDAMVMAPPTIKPAGYSERAPGLRLALDNPGSVGEQVQLGAWRQEAEAAAGWNRAVQQAGEILSGLTPHILAVDLPGRGRYYRLRVETAGSKQLCAVLTSKGLDCIPARD